MQVFRQYRLAVYSSPPSGDDINIPLSQTIHLTRSGNWRLNKCPFHVGNVTFIAHRFTLILLASGPVPRYVVLPV